MLVKKMSQTSLLNLIRRFDKSNKCFLLKPYRPNNLTVQILYYNFYSAVGEWKSETNVFTKSNNYGILCQLDNLTIRGNW